MICKVLSFVGNPTPRHPIFNFTSSADFKSSLVLRSSDTTFHFDCIL